MNQINEGTRVRDKADHTHVGTVSEVSRNHVWVGYDDDDGYVAKAALIDVELIVGVPTPVDFEPTDLECIMADVVRERMAELNLSWTTLCERTGVSRSTLARMLRDGPGRMYLDTVTALASGLGIEPGAFWRISE